MDFKGIIKSVSRNWLTDKTEVTFETDDNVLKQCESVKDKLLSVTAKKYRRKRSLDANALLWHCLGEISRELLADKWDVYLMMLRRYGQYTYIVVKTEAIEMIKRQWRESEVLGAIEVNGKPAVQMLCYYGSSTYDTKQFSVLLDGVISEMKEMGLEAPTSEQMAAAIAALEAA